MAKREKIVGLQAITKAIKALDGIAGSLNERVQETAVAIVEHGAGVGNGDMSKALDLVKVCRKHKLNIAFVVGWFAYFGNCNVNLRGNNGAGKVSLISKGSLRYRGFDVDGARANNWFDAIDDEGNRALWYQGPQPEEYNPNTIGDFAASVTRFVERSKKQIEGTVEFRGKEVPIYALSEADREQVHSFFQLAERIANTLARHEEVAEAARRHAEAIEASKQDEEIVELLQPKDKAVA